MLLLLDPKIQNRFKKYTNNAIKISNYPPLLNNLTKDNSNDNLNLCYKGL